ncbi:glutathione S-transferase family protein [Pelomonas sp. Root1444]|uniref:glutathione S-transferase family protein n=1 Tax=Pelomonas sp. Root1444 TaxID=1736464 RepID=UPI000703AD60|nr:glutathione binding-like protein [Pelomonas sp. Root1444]KQY85683.1 glutathione S-transferase [Pelomonas sp. Root1444]
MELYFSPMACSLASRVALYEAGAEARFTPVDKAKRTGDGGDYWQINPMGQVPALRTPEGWLLTENAAVLQYLAEAHPAAGLLPTTADGRARVRQWLGFIGTELHKAVFVPLLDPKAGAEVKAYAMDKAALRLSVLEAHLRAHEHLEGGYGIADIYLAVVLNWAPYAGVDLAPWPAVKAFHRRINQREAVARATREEFALYQEEQRRLAA